MNVKELMWMKIISQELETCGLMWGNIFVLNYSNKDVPCHTDNGVAWNIVMMLCTTDL